jgi:hypothetical protein
MSSAAGPEAAGAVTASPPDPLRLCVYATVAALAWWLGPFALLAFAALGLAGYLRARRAGLTRSKCVLRDTRLVIGYLAALAAAALVGIGFVVADWVR